MLGDKAPKYAAIGAAAKAKNVGLHSVGEDAKEEAGPKEKFVSKVTFIQSGDQLECEVGEENVRFSLASIRTKRTKRGEKENPSALQARELLRKKLIGKKVTVQPEYNWTAPSGTVIQYVSILNGTE